MKMINSGKSAPVIKGGSMTGSEMGISAENGAMAAYYLRDKVYEDKKLAVVREYITNALDEHMRHTPDRPIEVTVEQSDAGEYFVVRDFAKGLNDADVRGVFGMLFESTKNGSNDDMGGFGIGSKSGHAYTTEFMVTSWFDGYKSVYHCPLENDGKYKVPVGQIYDLSVEESDEPTGLEIRVPITTGDCGEFINKITNFVSNARPDAPVKATLRGEEVTPKPEIMVEKGDFQFSIPEASEYSYYGQNSSVVRMGDVCYPLPYWGQSAFKNKSVNGNLIISVPIGSMTLALSREAIEDTDSNRKLIERAGEALSAQLLISSSDIPLDWEGIKGKTFKKDIFKWGLWELGLPFNQVNCMSVGADTGKTYLVWIPNNRAVDAWTSKLREWARDDQENSYYYFKMGGYPKGERLDRLNEVDGDFELISIKKLRAELLKSKPTLVKSKSNYVMYPSGSSYKEKYTIEEFTELDGYEKIPKLDDIESMSELDKYSIREKSDNGRYGYGFSNSTWRVPSARARKELIAHGMFDYNADAVVAKRAEFRAKIREDNERKSAISDVLDDGVDVYRPCKTLEAIRWNSRTPEQTERLSKRCLIIKNRLNKIKEEDSPRAEILNQMGYSRKLSRATLRKVLALK